MILAIYAHDTHSAMHFICDIAVILHHVQADTLDTNLHRKLQAQMKTLCIYVEKQFTHFFHVKNPWHICGENIFMPKTMFVPKTICIYSSHSF